MKISLVGAASLVCLGASAALVSAQPPSFGYPRQAPDACGPGFYCANPCGTVYGPNYCLRPPFPPFNGMLPPGFPGGCGGGPNMGPGAAGPTGIAAFPTHPYARGPRDYFMLNLP